MDVEEDREKYREHDGYDGCGEGVGDEDVAAKC